MKKILLVAMAFVPALLFSNSAFSQARVMNAGETKGQLVYLSEQDVKENSEKYKALNAYSIPVFAELPLEMSVVAGAITLKQQNLLSHVQIKSRARKTPNLDISALEGGMSNALFTAYKDGDWIYMNLMTDGTIVIQPSTEKEAIQFYESKSMPAVSLKRDLTVSTLFSAANLGWQDFDKVGSKAANYAELAKALNTPDREVVRPGFAIPFYYYQQFLDENPQIQSLIEKALRDPLMSKVAKVSYREKKLKEIQDLILAEETPINQKLIDDLIALFDQVRGPDGLPRNLKLRSSTNSEDLPNFNGAGLYNSESYKPSKKGKEKKLEKKVESLKEALKVVWSSVWNLRAFDERSYFNIPHADVSMGVQVNLSFRSELVDGVVVTKNVANDPNFSGAGVYVESQRGDKHSVANPEAGVKPERVLVMVDRSQPLNKDLYQVQTLQKSNIADDMEAILPQDNPNPVMTEEEVKDLVYQSLKAEAHFKPLLGAEKSDFALDIEFKVDQEDKGVRQVYLKQARPYID